MSMTPIKQILASYEVQAPEVMVNELVLDSREVGVHSVFVAVIGHQLDGRDFIPQAVSLGAKLILAETEEPQQHGKLEMRNQSVIVHFYQLSKQLSTIAARFYGLPAEHLDVVAVTGTNGKTSTVQIITQLRHALGDGAASIGTLGAGLFKGPETELSKLLNTTPDAVQVQRLLADFRQRGASQVALEASSHALVQGRIEGLKTDVAVFTNLSRDHLDYHGSMEEYARAKRRLLQQERLKHVIINADDVESKNWLAQLSQQQTATLFSANLNAAQMPAGVQYCVATDIQYSDNGLVFELDSSWGKAKVASQLLGSFNVSNLLAALASQLVLGMPLKKLVNACQNIKPVAGRMELFTCAGQGNVIVDFAHTPDALEQALLSARHHCQGQLVCLFGCGGDRDKGKRPLMGQVAQKHSDKIVITTDNSRSEAPNAIAADILAGISDAQLAVIELDRKKAIREALMASQPGDLIVVAGKGHETTQTVGQHSLPYDERDYVNTLCLGKQS